MSRWNKDYHNVDLWLHVQARVKHSTPITAYTRLQAPCTVTSGGLQLPCSVATDEVAVDSGDWEGAWLEHGVSHQNNDQGSVDAETSRQWQWHGSTSSLMINAAPAADVTAAGQTQWTAVPPRRRTEAVQRADVKDGAAAVNHPVMSSRGHVTVPRFYTVSRHSWNTIHVSSATSLHCWVFMMTTCVNTDLLMI